jgi:Flp pilus assembly protein TadG
VREHEHDGLAVSRRSRRGAPRGQTLVEFALVLPVLMLLILGIFDLGHGVYAYNTVANAARTGARIAAVNQVADSPDCSNTRPIVNVADPHWSIRRCAAEAAISLGVDPADVSVTYYAPAGSTFSCATLHLGCIARVTVHYRYDALTPVISRIVGTIVMDQTSEMPIERIFP